MAHIDSISDEAVTRLVQAIDRGMTAGLAIQGQTSSNGTVQVLVSKVDATNAKLDELIRLLTPAAPSA